MDLERWWNSKDDMVILMRLGNYLVWKPIIWATTKTAGNHIKDFEYSSLTVWITNLINWPTAVVDTLSSNSDALPFDAIKEPLLAVVSSENASTWKFISDSSAFVAVTNPLPSPAPLSLNVASKLSEHQCIVTCSTSSFQKHRII